MSLTLRTDLDLGLGDGRASRHPLDVHDDGREEVDVGVVERELDEDGARARVDPLLTLHNPQQLRRLRTSTPTRTGTRTRTSP